MKKKRKQDDDETKHFEYSSNYKIVKNTLVNITDNQKVISQFKQIALCLHKIRIHTYFFLKLYILDCLKKKLPLPDLENSLTFEYAMKVVQGKIVKDDDISDPVLLSSYQNFANLNYQALMTHSKERNNKSKKYSELLFDFLSKVCEVDFIDKVKIIQNEINAQRNKLKLERQKENAERGKETRKKTAERRKAVIKETEEQKKIRLKDEKTEKQTITDKRKKEDSDLRKKEKNAITNAREKHKNTLLQYVNLIIENQIENFTFPIELQPHLPFINQNNKECIDYIACKLDEWTLVMEPSMNMQNLTQTLSYEATNMQTSYKNNVVQNYENYVQRFVNVVCEKDKNLANVKFFIFLKSLK